MRNIYGHWDVKQLASNISRLIKESNPDSQIPTSRRSYRSFVVENHFALQPAAQWNEKSLFERNVETDPIRNSSVTIDWSLLEVPFFSSFFLSDFVFCFHLLSCGRSSLWQRPHLDGYLKYIKFISIHTIYLFVRSACQSANNRHK